MTQHHENRNDTKAPAKTLRDETFHGHTDSGTQPVFCMRLLPVRTLGPLKLVSADACAAGAHILSLGASACACSCTCALPSWCWFSPAHYSGLIGAMRVQCARRALGQCTRRGGGRYRSRSPWAPGNDATRARFPHGRPFLSLFFGTYCTVCTAYLSAHTVPSGRWRSSSMYEYSSRLWSK
jgi:hypothetical protein